MRMERGEIDAVVLAGGINRIRLFEGDVPGYKALLPFAGKSSLRYVLEALRGTPEIGRIAVVGPAAELETVTADITGCEVVEGTPTLGGNIFLGLRHFSHSEAILFATADAPLVTAQAIADFLHACTERAEGGGEVFLSFVPHRAFTGPFRGHQKANVYFRDIVACHGNLALADPRLTSHTSLLPRIEKVYRARKHTLPTAVAFGWGIAVSYLVGAWFLRQLTLEKMAEIASRRLGVRLVPVLVERPEIAVDFDEPEEYAFVRQRLERKGQESGVRSQ